MNKAEYNKEYYARNREAILASVRDYRQRNKPALLEKERAYREKHRDRLRARDWTRAGAQLPTRPRPDACEVCGEAQRRVLDADHSHVTGKFRGWLCNRCNLGLGLFDDDVQKLIRMIDYLSIRTN